MSWTTSRAARTLLAIVLAAPAAACFVGGTPFEPEMCERTIVVDLEALAVAPLTIRPDTLLGGSCPASMSWTIKRPSPPRARASTVKTPEPPASDATA